MNNMPSVTAAFHHDTMASSASSFLSSSILSSEGGVTTSGAPSGAAVLVTGPESLPLPDALGVIQVQAERCETVLVTDNHYLDQPDPTLNSKMNPQSQQQQPHHHQHHPLLHFLEAKNILKLNNSSTNNHYQHDNQRKNKKQSSNQVSDQETELKDMEEFYHMKRKHYEDKDEDDLVDQSQLSSSSSSSCCFWGVGGSSLLTSTTNSNALEPAEVERDQEVRTYVLGQWYNPVHDEPLRRDDESSLFWFTYRCDFPEIQPYGIQSDAGWGCMLRSAQMLLAQALRMHYHNREWRPPPTLSGRRHDPFVRSLLTWFADFPSATAGDCVYSLHNMVAAGLQYDKLPGEWYGPATACYVIRDLVALHAQQLQSSCTSSTAKTKPLFRVHVAGQGTVYRDEIRQLQTRDARQRRQQQQEPQQPQYDVKIKAPPAHPLDASAWEEELVDASYLLPNGSGQDEDAWDTALLLLIPLRLGLDRFQEQYVQSVAHTFSLPQSVGVLGGRPRGARWFYGAWSDGSNILGLDPHTVQSAPRRKQSLSMSMSSLSSSSTSLPDAVDLSDEYLRSVHTTYPEVISLLKMDPSIALGFYCRTERDLEYVLSSMQDFRKKHRKPGERAIPELFAVADVSPDYAGAATQAAMQDMLTGSSDITGIGSSLLDVEDDDAADDDDDENELSDEDEYIML